MRHITALLPLSLAFLGAAEIVGQWTALGLTRFCTPEGISCTYILALDQNPDFKADLISCAWTVFATSNFRPANQTDFSEVKCNDKLSVNGGWNSEGFITIVPTDTVAGAYAFFGFTDAELANGLAASPRQRPAYRVGTFTGGDHPDLGLAMVKKMERRSHHNVQASSTRQKASSSPLKTDKLMKKKWVHELGDNIKKQPTSSSSSSSSLSEIDSCLQNCLPDDGPADYDILACIKNCRQQLHGPKINADSQSPSQKSFQKREHLDSLTVKNNLQPQPRTHNQQTWEAPATTSHHHHNNINTRDNAQETWQIHSLTRLTNHPLNSTLYTFSLFSSTTNQQLANCSITIPSVEPTHSWYGQRCDNDGGKYTVGWGYKPDTDSAVMTVCDKGRGMAWFGWDGVGMKETVDQEGKGEEEVVRFGDSRGEGVHESACS
ncbi:hypothetical protein QBC41DRAFT_301211 [Cercophora samala]|uniref:Uncharacterized protein n=1 Tax=Cercophora samala TaxID=330535 RepID=A0AA39ZGZ8_9PEZI|nr:hypothetical protein QBC41DRAFT_301211 [Cercophora samala]